MNLNYFIGEQYKYPQSRKAFTLKQVTGFIFHFDCGHWCTDNVFMDLIRVKTKVQVYKDCQMEIFTA
jgi:hypothetical protein